MQFIPTGGGDPIIRRRPVWFGDRRKSAGRRRHCAGDGQRPSPRRVSSSATRASAASARARAAPTCGRLLLGLKLGRSSCGGFPLGPELGSLTRSMLLAVAEQVLARRRVVKTHLAPGLRPKLEPQHLARHRERPVDRLHRRQTLVLALHQTVALQPRRQMLPRRVEQEILPHPQPRIDPGLPFHVFAPRVRRRHLEHEVRSLPLLPHLVVPPHPVLDPEHHERVGRDRYPRVAFLVVDEQISGDVHVGARRVVQSQRAEGVVNGVELGVVLRQPLAVRLGVVNRGGRKVGAAHGRASRTGGSVPDGCGSRMTVSR